MTDASELLFVGIDVSKATLEVALDDKAKTQTHGNDDAGVDALIARLKPMAEKVAMVLLEATGGLEQRAATALCANGFAVIVVNPRQAHDFAKALGHLAKTDSTDARALSHFARTLYASERRERLLYKLPTPEQELLLAMVTRRGQLVAMRVAESNRLASAHPSQRKSIEIHLKILDRQIGQIDDDAERHLRSHFKDKLALLKGLKGVGTGTQAMLMAALPELGALTRREIAKLVGVAPLNCDSGKFKGKRNHLGRACQHTRRPLHGHPERFALRPDHHRVLSTAPARGQAKESRADGLHAQIADHHQRRHQVRQTLAGESSTTRQCLKTT